MIHNTLHYIMQYIQSCKYSKRNLIGKIILLLQLQQGSLAVEAAGVAGERAIGSNNAVAGNDEGDGIASHGAAYGLRRAATDAASQFAVGHRLSVGDSKQGLPNTLLEWCASQQKVWGEIRFLSGEKDVEPTEGLIENR